MAPTQKQKWMLRILSMISMLQIFPALLNSIIKSALFSGLQRKRALKSKRTGLSFPLGDTDFIHTVLNVHMKTIL